MSLDAYCTHQRLKGNKMVPWRILKAKLLVTIVHFCAYGYNNLVELLAVALDKLSRRVWAVLGKIVEMNEK
jgi:hypothetical protein